MTKNLTQGKPMKLVLGFAAPLLFGVLFQQFYSFVDTAIVGQFLGADKLAAVGATGSINFLIIGLCLGFCSGFGIPIAQAFGANDTERLHRCVYHAILLSAGFSLVFGVLATVFCRPMLALMDTPAEIIDAAASYISIIFAAIPCCVLYNMASAILRSLGDSKTPVVFLVVASLVNIALDLFLIIVWKLDVAGAAIATAISQLVSGVGCVIVMIRRYPILRMSREERTFSPALAKDMLLVGLPMGLQYSITAVGSVVVQSAVNGLGVNAVAAVSAASKISAFFCCVFDALASTMATYAGQNIGARKLRRVDEGLRAASVIGCVYCVLAFGAVMLFARPLLSMFVDADANAAVMDMGVEYLFFNAAFYIPLLFVNIVRLSIQGMGFTRPAMFAGLFEMIARTAVALILVPRMDYTGACLANPAAWVMADLFLFPCYRHVTRALRGRLMPDVPEYQEPDEQERPQVA